MNYTDSFAVLTSPERLLRSDVSLMNELSFMKFDDGFVNEQRLIYECPKIIPDT